MKITQKLLEIAVDKAKTMPLLFRDTTRDFIYHGPNYTIAKYLTVSKSFKANQHGYYCFGEYTKKLVRNNKETRPAYVVDYNVRQAANITIARSAVYHRFMQWLTQESPFRRNILYFGDLGDGTQTKVTIYDTSKNSQYATAWCLIATKWVREYIPEAMARLILEEGLPVVPAILAANILWVDQNGDWIAVGAPEVQPLSGYGRSFLGFINQIKRDRVPNRRFNQPYANPVWTSMLGKEAASLSKNPDEITRLRSLGLIPPAARWGSNPKDNPITAEHFVKLVRYYESLLAS